MHSHVHDMVNLNDCDILQEFALLSRVVLSGQPLTLIRHEILTVTTFIILPQHVHQHPLALGIRTKFKINVL